MKFFLMREINELEHWISDKEALAGGEELGKDLEHVQALLKKEVDFEKDVEGNEPRLESINKMGEDMIEDGHSEAEEIQRICEVREGGRGRREGGQREGWTEGGSE